MLAHLVEVEKLFRERGRINAAVTGRLAETLGGELRLRNRPSGGTLVELLKDVAVGDFVLDVHLQSTAADYDHRDLCLVFGHRDPEHFYYAHLGKRADPHAHSIFIVNGAPRVSIASTRTGGIAWDDGWHRARIKRESATGRIEVFFDDMEKPVMTAEDRTFPWGRIGIGSFDDTTSSAEYGGHWYIFTAYLVGADSDESASLASRSISLERLLSFSARERADPGDRARYAWRGTGPIARRPRRD